MQSRLNMTARTMRSGIWSTVLHIWSLAYWNSRLSRSVAGLPSSWMGRDSSSVKLASTTLADNSYGLTPGLTWSDGDEIDAKLIETATATFNAATYTNTEGDSFDVTVTLDEAFVEPTVTLPITVTANGGAVEADYSGIPEELTFAPATPRRHSP